MQFCWSTSTKLNVKKNIDNWAIDTARNKFYYLTGKLLPKN